MNEKIIYAKTALLGEKLEAVDHAAVVISDGKIVFAGSRAEAEQLYPAQQYEVVDLGERVLLPGLFDSHTHTSLDARVDGHLEMMCDPAPQLTIRAVNNMRDDLLSGITTSRILGEKEYVDVAVRNAVESGELIGPRMLIAGIGMRSLHGHGFVGMPHTGPDEFRKTARENMLRKVNWLKVFVTAGAPPVNSSFIPSFISLEEIQAVTAEAKRNGLRTSAHCIGGQGLVDCVNGGIDVIDHGYCATDSDLELIAKNDRWVCLTPSVFMDLERNGKNPANVARNTDLGRDSAVSCMRKIVTSGVKYAIGSDALHANMPTEAKYAVELGASNFDAVAGVTVRAAQLCGVEAITGSITVGKAADLVAVTGNPLENIDHLNTISFVMKQGVCYKI